MLNKIVDVLKEVFWLKRSPAKKKRSTPKKKTVSKKKTSAPPKKASPKIVKPAKPVKVVAVSKKPIKPVKPSIDPSLVKVGEITYYFDRIKVAVIKITNGTLLIGDKVTIYGPKTKFVQKLWSMQIESQDVKVARKGQVIGIKVDKTIAVGDIVLK